MPRRRRARPRAITREQYEAFLRGKGYRIEGDLVYHDTPSGLWVEEIHGNEAGFWLTTVSGPAAKCS